MTAAFDGKTKRAIDLRPYVIIVHRALRERRRNIETGEGMRGGAQILTRLNCERAESVENFQLQSQRPVTGIGNLGFDLAELGGGEADLSRQRLAMNEDRVERRRRQLVAVLGCNLDKITEHVV